MITVYKLFRQDRYGKLHPLYVDKKKTYPIGVWLYAHVGELLPNGKVKGLGKGLALRPGFHSSEYPVALHIGTDEVNGKPTIRPDNQVWCECLIDDTKADYWQKKANAQGKCPRDKCLKEIPVNGYYRYKTNPNMYSDWFISGELMIVKVLTEDEVIAKNNETGIHDLPRKYK